MNKTKKDFASLLAELRREYLKGIPDRLNLLTEHLRDRDWEALYHDCHNLKGTGKTYGCPEFSELTLPMEILVLGKCEEGLLLFPDAMAIIKSIGESYQNKTPLDAETTAKFIELKNRLSDLAKPLAAKSLK